MAEAGSARSVVAMAAPAPASHAKSERRSSKPSNFVATCPGCGQRRVQYAYTQRTLARLLQKGQIVDAYCGTCDVVWPASAQDRAGYWANRD